jgi:phospholipase C
LRPTDPLKTTDPVNDALRGSTRRAFLIDGAGIVAAGSLAGGLLTSRRTWARAADLTEPAASQVEALRVLERSSMRLPDSLPNPAIASATDTVPQIEHVVVLMMENHSYDNFLGMLGRGAGQVARGDGFALATDSVPNATNP